MVDANVQGTSKTTVIFTARRKGQGQRDTQVDVLRCSKSKEAWKSKHMKSCHVIWNKF